MSKNFKRATKAFIAFALTVVMFVLSLTPAMAATKKAPSLKDTEATIVVGKTFNFDLVNKVKGSTYTWSSSNEKVAVVNKSGVVTGVGKGNTKIHCVVKTPDGTYRLTAKVTVLKPAARVEIVNKITTINVGESYNLNVNILPSTANDYVTWTTSDKTIADPTANGVFKAYKKGVVTITATTVSGRKDSVTIQVVGGSNDSKSDSKPSDDKANTDTPALEEGVVFAESFSGSVGKFVGRSAQISYEDKKGHDGKNGYLYCYGRTSAWNGATVDVTGIVKPGETYEVSGWVLYTEGNPTETFKITQQKNGGSWPAITGDVTVEKGKWTKLSGIMTVDPDTTQCEVYFEIPSNDTLSFYCDDLVIKIAK